MNYLTQSVGKNLKQARKSENLTQKDVAALLNMPQQQYSRYETGAIELNYRQIVVLCKLYKISPNDLFETD